MFESIFCSYSFKKASLLLDVIVLLMEKLLLCSYCSILFSAKPGSGLTDFECSKKCLRYPHDEQCPDGCECTGDFIILEGSE